MTEIAPAIGADRPLSRDSVRPENSWAVVVFHSALFALALVPILSVAVPPLVDYPNHLARMYILGAWESTPALQANYELNWRLQPNLAMDIAIPLLARIMPIYDAGRIFIAATLMLIIAAPLCLRWVLYRQIGVWPVVLYLFLFNHALHWGFLNFLFTAGLAILAFSAWIATRSQPSWSRAALFSAVSLILFFGHLMGLFTFGLLVLGYELRLGARRGWRHEDTVMDWLVSAGQFAAPAALFIHWALANQSTHKAVTLYGDILNKLTALLSPVHFGMPTLDLMSALFLGCVMVFCRSHRNVSLVSELKAPLLVMLAAAVLLPNMLSDVWGADFRLPTVIACILVAGTRFDDESAWQVQVITAVAVVLFSVRIVLVTDLWHGIGRNYDEFRHAVRAVPEGASMLAVGDNADAAKPARPYHAAKYWHMATLAVIERSLFVPTLFTGHTTVRASAARRSLDSPNGTPVSRAVLAGSADPAKSPYKQGYEVSRYNRLFWIGWPDTFDYALSLRFDNTGNPYPRRLDIMHSGSFFDLYRVTKP